MSLQNRFLFVVFLAAPFAAGCSSAYYATMEKIGIPKRQIMVSRVKSARASQEAAKEQFRSALEKFSSVVNFDGGGLQEKYNSLSAELARSEEKAQAVKDRIESVEDVSDALFAEWKSELKDYENQRLRRSSEEKLEATEQRYEQMMTAMRKAASKLDPVLQPLRDNVLYLKHNLNAEAIGSLDTELLTVQTNVDKLIRDLDASIEESNAFIDQLGQSGAAG